MLLNIFIPEKSVSVQWQLHVPTCYLGIFVQAICRHERPHETGEEVCGTLRSDRCMWAVLSQLWPAGIACEAREVIQTLDLNHWFQRRSCLSTELLTIHGPKCFIFSSWWSKLHSYQNQISILVVHIIVQHFASFFKCTYMLTSPSWYFLPLQENILTQSQVILLRNDTDINICWQE